ncbi:alpha/beta fold hydrolase [Nocardia sp. NPDC020380]|uniref:alpha/beta fold hydrolase n=1 Tax=Nocardia sp. NPDC020380 TaxID=3364309 RepID=UPI00378A311F
MFGLLFVVFLGLVVGVPAVGVFGYRWYRQAVDARGLRITDPAGIDESGFVHIGGLSQWISVRGDDRSNPVIVEIPGGPGASSHLFLTRTRTWERHFTIVRWDVRGSGRTFAAAPLRQGEMTLNQIYRDALEVVEDVRDRLGVDRVILLANSFGTNVGLRLARDHPELFHAYVGTDQHINAGGRERTAYRAMLTRLGRAGRKQELAAAVAMGSDRSVWTARDWSLFSKLVITSDSLSYDTLRSVLIRSLWFCPRLGLRGLHKNLRGIAFSEQLHPQAVAIDEWAEGTSFELPVFVFQGDGDTMTPPAPARAFLNVVTAPHKEFVLIENASHFAVFRQPEQFLRLLRGKVRPLTIGETACL